MKYVTNQCGWDLSDSYWDCRRSNHKHLLQVQKMAWNREKCTLCFTPPLGEMASSAYQILHLCSMFKWMLSMLYRRLIIPYRVDFQEQKVSQHLMVLESNRGWRSRWPNQLNRSTSWRKYNQTQDQETMTAAHTRNCTLDNTGKHIVVLIEKPLHVKRKQNRKRASTKLAHFVDLTYCALYH